jgi:hypothetical protein
MTTFEDAVTIDRVYTMDPVVIVITPGQYDVYSGSRKLSIFTNGFTELPMIPRGGKMILTDGSRQLKVKYRSYYKLMYERGRTTVDVIRRVYGPEHYNTIVENIDFPCIVVHAEFGW